MDENTSLRVRKGAQVFGPMTVIQLAELLAAGRVSETDEVCVERESWQSIADFFEQQMAPEPPPVANEASLDQDRDEDFHPVFEEFDAEGDFPLFPSPILPLNDVPPHTASPQDPPVAAQSAEVNAPRPPARSPKSPRKKAPVTGDSSDLEDALSGLLAQERNAPSLGRSPKPGPERDPEQYAPPPRLTAEERAENFVVMFNGKTFAGWRFREQSALPDKLPDNWKVERGRIVLLGGGKPALMTQWDYRDFDFRFAWRATERRSNGGLCLRSERKVGSNQISLRPGQEGTFEGEDLEGSKNAAKLQKNVGEWNDWRILAEGDRLTLWCNGQKAWHATKLEPECGYLGFLAADSHMEFANLRIRDLGWEYLNDLKANWISTDGRIVGWKQLGDSIAGEKGKSTPLQTVGTTHHNYLLRLDWKVTKATVGKLYLRGMASEDSAVQLLCDDQGSGGLPGMRVDPDVKADNPVGQWNFLEVRLAHHVVSVTLNGTQVISKAKLGRSRAASAGGPIALSHNGHPIQLRNIRIQSLDETPRGPKSREVERSE